MSQTATYELRGVGIDSTIVQPCALGTAFGCKMIQGREAKGLEGYSATNELFPTMARLSWA